MHLSGTNCQILIILFCLLRYTGKGFPPWEYFSFSFELSDKPISPVHRNGKGRDAQRQVRMGFKSKRRQVCMPVQRRDSIGGGR